MADSKLRDLTATTTLTDDANLYVVNNVGVTPVDRKITALNLATEIGDKLSLDTTYAPLVHDHDTETIKPDVVLFETPALTPTTVGSTYWDNNYKTIATVTSATTTLQHGQEVVVYCKNQSGVNIADGTPVYIVSGNGAVPTIAKADADSESTSYIIGLATQAINDSANGFVTVIGNVNGITTDGSDVSETWVEGDKVYLSSTAGKLTKVRPTPPAHGVTVGIVTYAHANNGTIFVHPSIGYELDELHDVLISGVAAGELIVRNGGNTLWENKTPAEAGLVQLSGGTMTGDLIGHTDTDYTTARFRNITLSASDPSGGNNGDVWIKYQA